MIEYSFDEQLSKGKRGEEEIDKFFEPYFTILPVTLETEKKEGYDRIFKYPGGAEYKVEYKTDYQANGTGNAFIETVSMDIYDKKGWAYTSKADYIIYYIVGSGRLCVIPMQTIKKHLPTWKQTYPEVQVKNKGFNAYGLLIPLTEIAKHCVLMADFLLHKLEGYDGIETD